MKLSTIFTIILLLANSMTSKWKLVIPEAQTNIIMNPSIETNATTWAGDGTNTVARSNEQSIFGAYSLKGTWLTGGSSLMGQYTLSGLTANKRYYISTYVYIPSDWDGGNITLSINVTGASSVNTTNLTTATTGAWVQLYGLYDVGATTSGTFELNQDSNPSNNKSIYIDGAIMVQIKTQSLSGVRYTYLDGDQAGCEWLGVPHASKSSRNFWEASGGRIMDFKDDLTFNPSTSDGSGMPPITNNLTPLALNPGSLFQSQSIQQRSMRLNGTIEGGSLSNFHVVKQLLVKALSSMNKPINEREQPRTLRYTGASIEKEIEVVYDGGLEGGAPMGFVATDIPLRLLAPDPFFKQVGENATVLGTNETATHLLISAYIDGSWTNFTQQTAGGTLQNVFDTIIHNGIMYIGGSFLNWNNDANMDYLVKYDMQTQAYSVLESAVAQANGVVRRIKVGPDGKIYIAGSFTALGSVTVNGIGTWDGTTFATLGMSVASDVRDMTWDNNGNLYIVSQTANMNSDAAQDYLAVYNGSSWSPVLNGLNNVGWRIDHANGVLYMTGQFTQADPGGTAVNANYVVSYNIANDAFSAMGDGLISTSQTVPILVAPNGLIYAGKVPNADSGFGISVWNGSAWVKIVTANSTVDSMMLADDGTLYYGGQFTIVDGTLNVADGIARYNGSSSSHVGIDLPGAVDVDSVYWNNGDLIIGHVGTSTSEFGQNTTVSYSGSAPAYPYITINRSGGTSGKLQIIRNYTTGAEIFLNVSVLDGETLTLRFGPNSATIESSFRRDLSGAILPDSDVGQFYLMPSNDGTALDNQIYVFVDEAGSPTITATMYWKDTYISED